MTTRDLIYSKPTEVLDVPKNEESKGSKVVGEDTVIVVAKKDVGHLYLGLVSIHGCAI